MPKTRLLMVRTAHCTIPFLWMDFGDGRPVVLPQLWVASPPVLDLALV
jgi:hypothetical protein